LSPRLFSETSPSANSSEGFVIDGCQQAHRNIHAHVLQIVY
jgi:hypothetical protein